MISKNSYHVIGLMSGTSLDGLDIAFCAFEINNNRWKSEILYAETVPYDMSWQNRLSNADRLTGLDLSLLHIDFGSFCAEQVNLFVKKHHIKPDFVASHGHTVFHQPEKGLTLQIGSGAVIAAKTNIDTISDFRTTDVARAGEGAPLVPIGDRLLFQEYDYCLNLGGIANISFEKENRRLGYDIYPCNIILNQLAQKVGKLYDNEGEIAKSGTFNEQLFHQFTELQTAVSSHLSLGKERIAAISALINENSAISIADKLHTFTLFLARQIAQTIDTRQKTTMLVTGGGAKNTFLIEKIRSLLPNCDVNVPSESVLAFKEALIFAFLGVLRVRNEANCLADVTGANTDSCGGAIYKA
jgi:anhydro-N-acetylmuramic acid kinase